jgi:hypothetical protein
LGEQPSAGFSSGGIVVQATPQAQNNSGAAGRTKPQKRPPALNGPEIIYVLFNKLMLFLIYIY